VVQVRFKSRWEKGHLADCIVNDTRLLGVVSVGFYAATIAIFGYLMFLPARGVPVNVSKAGMSILCNKLMLSLSQYMRWQRDPNFQTLIPLMTAFIVAGYVTMVITLSPLCA